MTHDDQCERWDEDGNSTGQLCQCAERALAQAQGELKAGRCEYCGQRRGLYQEEIAKFEAQVERLTAALKLAEQAMFAYRARAYGYADQTDLDEEYESVLDAALTEPGGQP